MFQKPFLGWHEVPQKFWVWLVQLFWRLFDKKNVYSPFKLLQDTIMGPEIDVYNWLITL